MNRLSQRHILAPLGLQRIGVLINCLFQKQCSSAGVVTQRYSECFVFKRQWAPSMPDTGLYRLYQFSISIVCAVVLNSKSSPVCTKQAKKNVFNGTQGQGASAYCPKWANCHIYIQRHTKILDQMSFDQLIDHSS